MLSKQNKFPDSCFKKRRASIMQWFLASHLLFAVFGYLEPQLQKHLRQSSCKEVTEFPQNHPVLPSKMLIRSAIYEGVNGTAQINQEPVEAKTDSRARRLCNR